PAPRALSLYDALPISARCADLIEGLKHHTRHRPLVPLAVAVDVEELQAAPGRRRVPLSLLLERPHVELLLPLAVRIERDEPRNQDRKSTRLNSSHATT